jgi:O-antigen ligase
MISIRNLDLRLYGVISMLVLWVASTFSIALMEITFVCALICWIGWHIQRRKWPQPSLSFPHVLSGNPEHGSPIKAFGDDKNAVDWGFWAPLALFFMFVLVSYFTSEYPKQSLQGLYKIAKPLLAFWMAIDLFGNTESQKRFRGIFLATFLLVAIDCSIQYAFGKDLLRGFAAERSGSGIRLTGPFGNFAIMATYLVLVIPIFGMYFWSDFMRPDRRKRSFYGLALVMAGLALLYLTRCRGALVALVLGFGIFFIYKRWLKALGVTILLCLVLLAAMPRNVLVHRNASKEDQSLSDRYYLWRRALDVIVAKPLTGTGINTYAKAHAKYDTLQKKNLMPLQPAFPEVRQNRDGSVSFISADLVLTSDTKQTVLWNVDRKYTLVRDKAGKYFIYDDLVVRNYYAHNGYLQLAAEIGLPGTFFFLLFLVIFFKRSFRALNAVRGSPEEYTRLGLLIALLVFLIYAATDNNLQSPMSLMKFWYLAGILMARQNNQKVLHA